MPKTRVHSTLCKVPARSRSAYAHYARTPVLRKNIIGGWRELDMHFDTHETHHSSMIMNTYHSHTFGILLGIVPAWLMG